MTWFKENKFLACLLTVTLAFAALILFFGLKAGSALEEVRSEIDTKQSKLDRMKRLDPYPTPESARAKKENLQEVIARGEDVRLKLLAFRPESLENPAGKAFAENLAATVDRVKALFPDDDSLSDNFNLGFEAYSGSLPREDATGILTYQMASLEYLFEQLADAGVTEVTNLYRPKLAPENGEAWQNEAKPARGKRQRRPLRGERAEVSFEKLPYIAHRLPFELVFRAPEASVRKALGNIANSSEYFFAIKSGRVLNPAPIPSAGSARAEASANEGFDSIVIEGLESAETSAPSKMLEKVSGGDDLSVHLRVDLLLFLQDQTFPTVK